MVASYRLVFAVFLGLCAALPSLPQITTAEITGTVTDPGGAVVTGAKVTVTNVATSATRTSTSNEEGVYRIPSLNPGLYTLRIELAGFTAQVRTGVELQVAQVGRIDVALQVGNVSEVVEVKASVPLIDTDTTSLGTVIENQRIVELPLNGRNYLQLAALTPGATTAAPASFVAGLRQGGTRSLFTLSVAGQRIFFNRYSLDGLENTDPNWQSYIFLPSLDALQEFKVESGTVPAEYGLNVTQINVTTKSGGNNVHATAWWFVRNNAFDARNFFTPATAPMPPFRRNQFGFTLGGPVVIPKLINGRNKLFFMVNYEGLRERKALVQPSTVPPQGWVAGNFSAVNGTIFDPFSRQLGPTGAVLSSTPFPGNIIPRNRIAPISTAYMTQWMPQVPGLTVSPNNFVNTEGRPTDANQQNARFDYTQSSNVNWFFRYSHQGEFQYNPTPMPGQGNNVPVQAHSGVFGNTRVFGPNKVNEFRAGVSRFENSNIPIQAGVRNVVRELGIDPAQIPSDFPLYWGVPNLTLGGGFTLAGNSADSPFNNYDTMIQANNNFSWNKGKHSLKFGGEVMRTRFNQLGGVTTRGRFNVNGQYSSSGIPGQPIISANNVADFMLGTFSVAEGQIGVPLANYRNLYHAYYLQDTWRVGKKLTVNFGLRWENYTPWTDKFDNIINVDMKWDNSVMPTFVRAGNGDPYQGNPCCRLPASIPFVRDGRRGRGVQKNRLDSWGPRIGLAYQINSKTVFRSGAGIYYAQEIQNKNFEVVRNAPLSIRRNEVANTNFPNLTWDRIFTTGNIPSLAFGHEYDVARPRIYQWSAGVQRQLSANASFEVAYVGSSGNYLEGPGTFNVAAPGPGNINARRPFPIFNGTYVWIEGAYQSNYNALQAKFQHRLSNGLNLLSAYTYGKSIDNNSAYRTQFGDGGGSDPYNKRLLRGRSAFDFRQNWTTSLLYQLPFGRGRHFGPTMSRLADTVAGGWQVGSIITMVTGFPSTPGCGSGAVQNGDGGCYPDATGISPKLPRGEQDPRRWFNTAAFVNRLPNSGFRYGNSGRNVIDGPGLINWDVSAIKNFKLTEKHNLELRIEYFNAANHPNFGIPGGTVGGPTYGVISNTASDSRQGQFALRYSF